MFSSHFFVKSGQNSFCSNLFIANVIMELNNQLLIGLPIVGIYK